MSIILHQVFENGYIYIHCQWITFSLVNRHRQSPPSSSPSSYLLFINFFFFLFFFLRFLISKPYNFLYLAYPKYGRKAIITLNKVQQSVFVLFFLACLTRSHLVEQHFLLLFFFPLFFVFPFIP